MEADRQQYERIARYLDGQPLELTPAERELLAEIQRDQHALGRLDVALPVQAVQRARRRMAAPLAGRTRRRVLRYVVGVEAAAVAAMLLVAVTLSMLSRSDRGRTGAATVPTSVLMASAESSAGGDLDVLARQLDELEVEILASLTPSQSQEELEIDALEAEVRDFLLNGAQEPWSDWWGG